MTRDGMAESVSRDQNVRRERGQGMLIHSPSSADNERDWQPYTVHPYSAKSDDHINIQTYNT